MEVNVGSLQATWPPSCIEQEENMPEVIVLANKVSVLVDEEPPSVRKPKEPFDAGPSDEDNVQPLQESWRITRSSHVSDTTPVGEGDWLREKDITAGVGSKLYHANGDPVHFAPQSVTAYCWRCFVHCPL